jgi:hypothetical protein
MRARVGWQPASHPPASPPIQAILRGLSKSQTLFIGYYGSDLRCRKEPSGSGDDETACVRVRDMPIQEIDEDLVDSVSTRDDGIGCRCGSASFRIALCGAQ